MRLNRFCNYRASTVIRFCHTQILSPGASLTDKVSEGKKQFFDASQSTISVRSLKVIYSLAKPENSAPYQLTHNLSPRGRMDVNLLQTDLVHADNALETQVYQQGSHCLSFSASLDIPQFAEIQIQAYPLLERRSQLSSFA